MAFMQQYCAKKRRYLAFDFPSQSHHKRAGHTERHRQAMEPKDDAEPPSSQEQPPPVPPEREEAQAILKVCSILSSYEVSLLLLVRAAP